jgi:hypothetical protein
MSLDTAPQPSNASLSVSDAAALFDAPVEEVKPEAQAEEPAKVEPARAPEATQADPESETEEQATDEAERVTIEIDGKTVELTKAELADAYKNGLRQADYTRKTMEAAEQRKAAETETSKAREERQRYERGLQQAQAVLQAQLHEQSQIDWNKLLEADPVEYLKQQHLANQRQARLQNINQEQQHLHARHQDHRLVLVSRKAMLYDQMMAKASAAAKKVANLPQKVERPGASHTNPSDGRTVAMKRLSSSGSLQDAAKALEGYFK